MKLQLAIRQLIIKSRGFTQTLIVIFVHGGSLGLGATYSVYNTDFHHWGFILGTILDSSNGARLFLDTYVQYGPGQAILFRFLSTFFSVDYTSIGFFSAIVYALSLWILYLCVARVASKLVAVLTVSVAFLIHPYAFYPWPDYYAGLCICASTYFLLTATSRYNLMPAIFSGILLAFSCTFRSTYVVSIGMAFIMLSSLCLIFRRKIDRRILSLGVSFLISMIFYIVYLWSEDVLVLWYAQSIGAASSSYSIGWKQLIYLGINIISPTSTIFVPFTLLFFSGIFLIGKYFLLPLNFKASGDGLCQVFVFLAILGLAGAIQSIKFYEIFRLQNSCISLYVVAAQLWVETRRTEASRSLDTFRFIFPFILFSMLVVKFPFQILGREGMLFPLLHFGSKADSLFGLPKYDYLSDISVLKGHRVDSETASYYTGLEKLVCRDGKVILNLTGDSLIPYLCGKSRNSSRIPFFSDELLANIDLAERDRIRSGRFYPNELVVTQDPQSSDGLQLRGVVERPTSFRWFKEGKVLVYENTIVR
jgi:hypothetical protein